MASLHLPYGRPRTNFPFYLRIKRARLRRRREIISRTPYPHAKPRQIPRIKPVATSMMLAKPLRAPSRSRWNHYADSMKPRCNKGRL